METQSRDDVAGELQMLAQRHPNLSSQDLRVLHAVNRALGGPGTGSRELFPDNLGMTQAQLDESIERLEAQKLMMISPAPGFRVSEQQSTGSRSGQGDTSEGGGQR